MARVVDIKLARYAKAYVQRAEHNAARSVRPEDWGTVLTNAKEGLRKIYAGAEPGEYKLLTDRKDKFIGR